MSAEQQLQEILSELGNIEFGDKEKLASLLRKTEVYLKKVFGDDSEYYERYCHLSFVPEGVIYNTGHYKNKEAWDIGMANYHSFLETVGYEFQMKNLGSRKELEYPAHVTFHWLRMYVPIKVWLSFAGLLVFWV